MSPRRAAPYRQRTTKKESPAGEESLGVRPGKDTAFSNDVMTLLLPQRWGQGACNSQRRRRSGNAEINSCTHAVMMEIYIAFFSIDVYLTLSLPLPLPRRRTCRVDVPVRVKRARRHCQHHQHHCSSTRCARAGRGKSCTACRTLPRSAVTPGARIQARGLGSKSLVSICRVAACTRARSCSTGTPDAMQRRVVRVTPQAA